MLQGHNNEFLAQNSTENLCKMKKDLSTNTRNRSSMMFKVPLMPNFSYLFSKTVHNLVKIKKELSKSIKSPQNYECLKLRCSGSGPCNRRSGT